MSHKGIKLLNSIGGMLDKGSTQPPKKPEGSSMEKPAHDSPAESDAENEMVEDHSPSGDSDGLAELHAKLADLQAHIAKLKGMPKGQM